MRSRRHKHNLSNYNLLTAEMGAIIPCGCVEVLPGDTFQQRSSVLIRVSPLLAPVMHPVTVRIHHFYVPMRIIWDGWENFITGGPTGNDASTIPQFTQAANGEGLVPDYLGIPPIDGLSFSELPIRAYNKIFNEYYRDQDLHPEVSENSRSVQNCAWEKDYFSSARPWPQKGDSVTIPIAERAPIIGIGKGNSTWGGPTTIKETNGVDRQYQSSSVISNDGPNSQFFVEEDQSVPGYPNIWADLSQTEAISINEFRTAFAKQRYAEARARYGSRYTEFLAYYGIRSSDARLQRPEYLGGGKQTISFSEILQTAPDATTDTPVGEMRGHGIAALRTRRYRKFFEEHGYVMSLMSVRPKAIYSSTMNRKFTKTIRDEFWQKELEHIGQQAISNKELYAGSQDPNGVFGYQDRYREYREEPSIVTGEYRDILDYWHMARKFSAQPVLNESFIDCVPTKRVYAEQTKHPLWCMVNHSIQARRMVTRNASGRIM